MALDQVLTTFNDMALLLLPAEIREVRRGEALPIYTQVHLPAKMPEHAGRDDGAADGTPRSERLEEQLDLTCHPLIKHGEGLGFMGRFDRPEFVLSTNQVQIVQGPESQLWSRQQDSAGDHVELLPGIDTAADLAWARQAFGAARVWRRPAEVPKADG